ncbi:MAG: insulinase family protein [Opitutaceae bacterium]|nr:insulinase family protein [Opitutaceae bacterium]
MALNKAIWASAYTAHPYHNPVIGWRSDIENVPIGKLRAFHDTYYWPDNCTLTLAGDFTEAAALEAVHRHFAALPRAPHPIPELYTVEPAQEGPRRTVVHRAGQPGVVGVAFKRPSGLHPDSAALALLTTALGDGMTSRLYRALVDTGLASEVFVDNNSLRDPGLLLCYAMLAPGVPHERAEAMLNSTLHAVAEQGLTSEEIQRARRQLTAQRAFKRDGGAAVAAELNESIALGDWTDYATQAARLDAVTPADLQRVARETFAERHSTTGWFVPAGEEEGSAELPSSGPDKSATPSASSASVTAVPPPNPAASAPHSEAFGDTAHPPRVSASPAPVAGTLFRRPIGGIDFVARPTGVSEVVTIVGSLAAGDAFSPADNTALALLTAALLDKGTTRHDKFALAELLAGMGATIEFGSDRLRVEFTARCLRADAPAVIALLAEQLRQPAFASAEVAKEKARLAGELQQAMDQPGARAAIALSRALWPEGHPQRQPELPRTLADLALATPTQVAEFHRSHYGPRSLRLVAVGDLDPATIATAVERSFEGWVGGSEYPAPPKLPAPQTHGQTVELPMAEKPSLTLLLGQTTGLQARDTDALALKLATHTLGGPTFTSRLISTIRDTEGLTYGIGARVGVDSITEGSWFIRGTFDTTLLGRGEASTRRELSKWFEQGITAEELAAQKTNYVGVFKLGLATTTGMAEALLGALERGEGPEAVDSLGARVNALSLSEVNAAIRHHLDPALMVVIKAGTLPGP